MGTFHAFVSEPLPKKEDADTLLAKVSELLSNSHYRNNSENCTIVKAGNFYIVVGVIKNLGGQALELMDIDTTINIVAISDERDFTEIENRPQHSQEQN